MLPFIVDPEDIKTLARIEAQVARFASDIESEKRTRAEANREINSRLFRVEKFQWSSTGAIIAVQALVGIILAIWK